MAVSYETIRAPFSESLIGEIHGLAERVFGTGIDDGGAWRFENMPDFTVIEASAKPYIQRSDGSAKGDWDVGITIDVLDAARDVDTVVLLSGDGDFDLLLEKIKRDHAVAAEVYGVPERVLFSPEHLLHHAPGVWPAVRLPEALATH